MKVRPWQVMMAAAAAVVGVALVVPDQHRQAEAAVGGVTFQDDFNGASGSPVDSSKWKFDIGGGGWGNNEREYYTDSTRNASLDGQGNLAITARRENPANYQCHYGRCEYTSARLLTAGKFSQRYGRFEARMKLPRGQGIWPAFWMLGDNGNWPDRGELDIMENIGREPNTVYGTVHGPGYSGAEGITGSRNTGAPLSDAFHTYTVDWSPNLIIWYLDGSEFHRITPGNLAGDRWVFDTAFFMILNVAVGGNWPGYPDGSSTYPQTMLVDYVRVSAYDGGDDPPGGGNTAAIRSQGGRCLDIHEAKPTDGKLLQIYDCNNSAAQRWTFEGDGTIRGMGLCMDAAGAGTGNGTPIQLAHCNGNPAQRFTLNGAGDLVNVAANKCVDITGHVNANFTKLTLWDCHGQWNQKWSKA